MLAYNTGCLTPSCSCKRQAPKLRLEASVCKMNSRSKSGNFNMGSLDSKRFISVNAFSLLSPHLTNSGALFLVSSVICAVISAQFGIYRQWKLTIRSKLLLSFFVLGLPVLRTSPTVSFCGAIASFCKVWPKKIHLGETNFAFTQS